MVKSRQKFPNRGGVQKNQKFPKFKNFPNKGGGGSQNLGTVPKLYLVINYEVKNGMIVDGDCALYI